MPNADEALAPSSMPSFAPKAAVITTKAESAGRIKETQLAQLTQYPGWQHFRTSYVNHIQALRMLTGVDLQGKSYEEIGQLTLAYRIAADVMESELKHIDSIAQAVYQTKNKVVS